MTDTTWIEHPLQRDDTRGYRRGLPLLVEGPVIEPETLDDGTAITACIIAGHCSDGDHAGCWQAAGAPDLDHDLDACATAHRLRCRCTCHDVAPEQKGRLF